MEEMEDMLIDPSTITQGAPPAVHPLSIIHELHLLCASHMLDDETYFF